MWSSILQCVKQSTYKWYQVNELWYCTLCFSREARLSLQPMVKKKEKTNWLDNQVRLLWWHCYLWFVRTVPTERKLPGNINEVKCSCEGWRVWVFGKAKKEEKNGVEETFSDMIQESYANTEWLTGGAKLWTASLRLLFIHQTLSHHMVHQCCQPASENLESSSRVCACMCKRESWLVVCWFQSFE